MSVSDAKLDNVNALYKNGCDLIYEVYVKKSRLRITNRVISIAMCCCLILIIILGLRFWGSLIGFMLLPGYFFLGVLYVISSHLGDREKRYLQERDAKLRELFPRQANDDPTLAETKLTWLRRMKAMKPCPVDREVLQRLGYSPDEL